MTNNIEQKKNELESLQKDLTSVENAAAQKGETLAEMGEEIEALKAHLSTKEVKTNKKKDAIGKDAGAKNQSKIAGVRSLIGNYFEKFNQKKGTQKEITPNPLSATSAAQKEETIIKPAETPVVAKDATTSSAYEADMQRILDEKIAKIKLLEEKTRKDEEDQIALDKKNEESEKMMNIEIPAHQTKVVEENKKVETPVENKEMSWVDDYLASDESNNFNQEEADRKDLKGLSEEFIAHTDETKAKKEHRVNEFATKVVDTMIENTAIKKEEDKRLLEEAIKHKKEVIARYAEVKKRQVEIAPLLGDSRNRNLIEENDELIKEVLSLEKELERTKNVQIPEVTEPTIKKPRKILIRKKFSTMKALPEVGSVDINENPETITAETEEKVVLPREKIVLTKKGNPGTAEKPEPTNESTVVDEKGGEGKSDIKETAKVISPENTKTWKEMSEEGKEIISKPYRIVEKVSFFNRVLAKMSIAYNQFRINDKEGNSVVSKNKMDVLNIKSKASNASKNELLQIIEDMKKDGTPGVSSLLLKIKEIEKNEREINNAKDKIQSSIEKRENQIKLFANKRDQVAEKLIGHFEKKLAPIEEKLLGLEDSKNRLGLCILVSEAKHEESTRKLAVLNEKRAKLMATYSKLGYSESKTKRDAVIKLYDEQIKSSEEKIIKEIKKNTKKQNEINEKIAKTDAKAAPYRDKKNQYIRIKDGRPIKIELEERNVPRENMTRETTSSFPRPESSNKNAPTPKLNVTESSNPQVDGAPTALDLIKKYNDYLEQHKANKNIRIDQISFLRETTLRENNRLTTVKFIQIIKQYYKVNRIPESDYLSLINNMR